MPLYRMDRQNRIATTLTTTGFYVWTNVFYFRAESLEDRDFYVGLVQTTHTRLHRNIVDQGAYRLATWPDNVQVALTPTYGIHNTFLPGDPAGLINTIRLTATCIDGSLWYKRIRVPLTADEIGPQGYLTDAAHSYFQTVAGGFSVGGFLRSGRDSQVGPITCNPRVYSWQLRHGTKRSARVTLI